MTSKELSELKQGDVVRHEPTGAAYIVLSNRAGDPTVVRSIELHNAREWEHVYTPEPVKVPAPPTLSIIERVTELDKRGWTFEDSPSVRWTSPDGYHYYSLEVAYKSRGCHPSKADIEAKQRLRGPRERRVKSFSEARCALHAAGWRNVYGKVWLSPAGCYFDGTLAAFQSYNTPSDTGDCNAS